MYIYRKHYKHAYDYYIGKTSAHKYNEKRGRHTIPMIIYMPVSRCACIRTYDACPIIEIATICIKVYYIFTKVITNQTHINKVSYKTIYLPMNAVCLVHCIYTSKVGNPPMY